MHFELVELRDFIQEKVGARMDLLEKDVLGLYRKSQEFSAEIMGNCEDLRNAWVRITNLETASTAGFDSLKSADAETSKEITSVRTDLESVWNAIRELRAGTK